VQIDALVDSGANATFINIRVVKNNNLEMKKLAKPLLINNADGTHNKGGIVTHYITALIEIGSHKSTSTFLVADIGSKDVIIGLSYTVQTHSDCSSSCPMHSDVFRTVPDSFRVFDLRTIVRFIMLPFISLSFTFDSIMSVRPNAPFRCGHRNTYNPLYILITPAFRTLDTPHTTHSITV
jgi:hypothetical protein